MSIHRILLVLSVLLGATALGADPPDQTYADRMASEHAEDEATSSPAADTPPAAAVVTEDVVYATVDGSPVRGVLARPASAEAGAPAVIVIHEWWGLNENIRAMAERLAGEGYQALAVDLYRGDVATSRDDARSFMQRAMESPEQLEENLRQAHRYLTETMGAPRVGVIGWCFGGGWSLRASLAMPKDIAGTVIYYGRLVTDSAALAAIENPVLGIFGSEDRGIPVADVRRFEQALEDLGKDARIHVYEGADHAFANPTGTRYQAAAAEDAWAKTLTFFAETLRP